MKIDLHIEGLEATSPLRAHVQRRLGAALGRFRDRIAWARVWVRDINGPRGGADKHCQVQVRVKGGSDIILHERQVDTRSALDIAAGRVIQVLSRQLARQRRPGRRRAGLELQPV